MKLRNMSATVDHVASITLRLENGENLQRTMATKLEKNVRKIIDYGYVD